MVACIVKSVCNNFDVVPLEVYKVDIQYQVSYTPFPSGRTSLLGGNRRIINMLQKASMTVFIQKCEFYLKQFKNFQFVLRGILSVNAISV